MSLDEYVELRIPVPEEDRESLRQLEIRMDEVYSDFVLAYLRFIQSPETEVDSADVTGNRRMFMEIFNDWAVIAQDYSILDRSDSESGEKTAYSIRDGLTGYHKNVAEKVVRDLETTSLLFSSYESVSQIRDKLRRERLPTEDDIPF